MLNLITDTWIPVRRETGCDVIRPDQIADPDVLFPDWPRADLNLACLELLIGMVYLADPPISVDDWKSRTPDADRLRDALAPLAPAFNLLGDGPRFLQDFDNIGNRQNAPDMLFIDSAGESTAKKNADLMVKRSRYPALDPALAAMALYTLQAFAPAGGRGNRTSMRGGGPMVTLVRPDTPGLWSLIWANVPQGTALGADELGELPWMRPTETSREEWQVTVPPEGDGVHPEVFFGQPRRLKLTADNSGITGVIQARHGTNYEGWIHPLSPYYHIKNEVLPKHPKAGGFGYRNWRGIVLQADGRDRAACLERFIKRRGDEPCRLLVGGWAMLEMSPLDFLWSETPVFALDPEGEMLAGRLVEAAEQGGKALALAVRDAEVRKKPGTGNTPVAAAARAQEQFFADSQGLFERQLGRIAQDGSGKDDPGAEVAQDWLRALHRLALKLFDGAVMPGLVDLSETRRRQAVEARRTLLGTFSGFGGAGRKIFTALGMNLPKKRRKTEGAT